MVHYLYELHVTFTLTDPESIYLSFKVIFRKSIQGKMLKCWVVKGRRLSRFASTARTAFCEAKHIRNEIFPIPKVYESYLNQKL